MYYQQLNYYYVHTITASTSLSETTKRYVIAAAASSNVTDKMIDETGGIARPATFHLYEQHASSFIPAAEGQGWSQSSGRQSSGWIWKVT